MFVRIASGAVLLSGLLLTLPVYAENLQQIYQQSLQRDPVIRRAEAEHRARQQAVPIARSRFLPRLGVSADLTHHDQEVTTGTTVTESTYESSGMSAVVTQPLYHSDAFSERGQASREVKKAELDFKSAQQELILRVAQTYFEVLAARDNLGFARVEKAAIEKQLEQTKQRFNVGLIAVTDVHESQARFDLSVAREIDAENRLANAHEALREITGQYYQQLSSLMEDTPLDPPQPASVDNWVKVALEQNLALLAGRQDLEIAELEVSRRRGERLPTLDLVGVYSVSDMSDAPSGTETEQTQVGLQLNWTLYQGGFIGARVNQAGEEVRLAKENLESLQRAVVRNVRNAYLGVLAGISRVRAFKQAVVSTQSALKATEAGYEVGTRTTVDVLDARTVLYLAERNYAQSRYDYITSLLSLKQVAGTLSADDLVSINGWLSP